MTDNTSLIECVDDWYDELNDAHEHIQSDVFCGGSHYPHFAQYFYTYLSVIDEFSDSIE